MSSFKLQNACLFAKLHQKALDAFCNKFHISEEVHLVFPNQDDTMHERPAGKIRLYTRFFEFANFRFPFSTFLVVVLRYFRINISQLSVIGAAKNDHFFWVDDFACPASFPWHTGKYVTRDPDPVAVDFNEQDYATLVAHPSLFWKFPEAFVCLVGLRHHYTLDEETYPQFLHKNVEEMDIFAFIHTPDPTKEKIVERDRNEGESLLLKTTIGRTVLLLPVASDHTESELDASGEKLFDEGGSGNQTEQGDSQSLKRQGKRKSMVVDAGEASHPPKKLREDHGTPTGTFVIGKSMSTLKGLLAEAVLNAEVGVVAIPTLPFMTASISTTPMLEGGDHTDSVAGLNLRNIVAPPRFVISPDSFYHYGNNVAEAEFSSLIRSFVPIMTMVTTITSTLDPASVAKEKLVEPYLFCAGSFLAGGTDPAMGGFSDLTGSDFLVGAIRTVIEPDADLQKNYVP
nr:hypothetical protein [Tanacetum cinerariifolium]